MTDANTPQETFATAGQISVDDLAKVVSAGFKSLICFRPDHEGGPTQPTFAAIAEAAQEFGLKTRHIPVIPGQIDADQIAQTRQALTEMPAPILGYCASGARANHLYKIASQ